MSRTYRKSSFTDERSLRAHLNEELNYYKSTGYRAFSRYKNKSLEEVLSQEEAWYKRWNRDGTWNESTANQYFKKLNKTNIRRNNKRLYHKILRDDDYDQQPYVTDYHGNQFVWSVW